MKPRRFPFTRGAGETLAFNTAVRRIAGSEAAMMRFPTDLAGVLEPEQLRRIGQDYVSQIAAVAPRADRVVDKALGNFVFAGLIRLALPNARIIHARRNAPGHVLFVLLKALRGRTALYLRPA
jgi:hypothetical protein